MTSSPSRFPPRTQYAKSGDLHIAYQCFGDGPTDVVFVPNWINHLEAMWDQPALARFLRRLGSFARVVCFDKRSTGMSDSAPFAERPRLELWMDDMLAVLDATGIERPALFATSGGGMMTLLFAATYPERTDSLVLLNTFARMAWAEDYPWGLRLDLRQSIEDTLEREWSDGGGFVEVMAPSLAGDPAFREWWGRYRRQATSPGAAVAVRRIVHAADVREILPVIRVPTLVLHRVGDRYARVEFGRYIAERIPGARYRELAGDDHLYFVGDTEAVLGEVEEHLTGARRVSAGERVLATVMFTDIVGSTRMASDVGDKRWRDLLDTHDRIVRQELTRHRGREIRSTGDGFLASFEGPGRAIECAQAIREGLESVGVRIRAGVHTGECEVRDGHLDGLAIHIGARVGALAGTSEILVTGTVKDLVIGSGINFEDRGLHAMKGVPEKWQLFAVAE